MGISPGKKSKVKLGEVGGNLRQAHGDTDKSGLISTDRGRQSDVAVHLLSLRASIDVDFRSPPVQLFNCCCAFIVLCVMMRLSETV